MGVEEEFLLLADDGSVTPVASSVVRLAGQPANVKPEYMAYQVETTTAACGSLDELRRDLVRLRLIAADAAQRAGAQLVAVGAVPVPAGPLGALSDDQRYRSMARRYPDATAAGGTCACHVHIGLPTRELAVAVLTRIRGWLPALLALTVNSPFAGALDSGWASFRYHTQLRWPTFRPPCAWASAERYDRAVHSLITSGAAIDEAGVYFLARLSPVYPTVEVRVADTCLDVEDTVVFAGIVRALVASLVNDIGYQVRTSPVPSELVDAQLLTAAHGQMRIPTNWATEPASVFAAGAVARLLTKIAPYLTLTNAADEVYAGLERMYQDGTGADRQRRIWSLSNSTRDFVRRLAEATAPVAATR